MESLLHLFRILIAKNIEMRLHCGTHFYKLDCTGKFRDFHRSGRAIRELSNLICIENRLPMIEDPKRQSMSYNKWLDSWAGFSYWEEVRILIDEVLEKIRTPMPLSYTS